MAEASKTYVAGEDRGRLARAAELFGLETARRPLRNVRRAVDDLFHDCTLTSARMHSVGALGRDERVDKSGTLHVLTTRHKRSRTVGGEVRQPDYGTLADLFEQQGPMELEEEEEEIIDTVEGGSLTAAVFGIIKGTVGPAILYLPRGFEMAGYAVAIVSMILATASYLYSAHRLLQCWRVEKQKGERLEEIRALLDPTGSDKQQQNSADASTATLLLTYPELARRAFGGWSAFVQIGIALMQFGVCLTYLIFVPQNLVESIKALFGLEVEKVVFLVLMIAIEIPLTWIRDIRKLTPTNVLATFLIAYGLVSCLAIAYSVVIQDPNSTIVKRITQLPATNDTWYLFIGTSFFVFEGSITLLVPLQEAVFHPEDKKKFAAVNQTVTCSIVVFYIFFALSCWAAFGGSVKTALTASLPEGAFSTTVQFAYSVAVMFTFPLQAYPAMEVVFHSSDYSTTNKSEVFRRNLWASLITCFLGIVAFLAIDYLGNVVSLLGSLVGIPIALIYPPLMHNKLVKGPQTTQLMNNCVAIVGVLAMGAASFTTIVSWDKGAEG